MKDDEWKLLDKLSELSESNEESWVLDSGASFQATSRKRLFEEYVPGNLGKVYLGDDLPCDILGKGTMKIKLNWPEWKLNDVRHIPYLRNNLIFVEGLLLTRGDDNGLCKVYIKKVLVPHERVKFDQNGLTVGEAEDKCVLWDIANVYGQESGNVNENRSSWNYQNQDEKTKKSSNQSGSSSSKSFNNSVSADMASERLALGLNATGPLNLEDVKTAYRACAVKWHPDHHQGLSKGSTRKINFCQWCGGPTKHEIPDGEEKTRAICTHCGKIAYENPKMVVGCLIQHENKILLCKRKIQPSYGLW
ncbi:hypothetical protein RD792_008004 [Penstemon davidsonii]|uniref:J domain-containing protein n=1 Tax=Penstemon davidsonii TaxID=160366 RepID=A0ABR0D8P7_9LAMI|nr:hypothetical protein RD792_008004 [Penstemon davidsonii]